MRKTLVTFAMACALGTGVAVVPGCNSAWWQNFQNDPVAQVQTFEATVQIAINAAELAWPAILPAIPADKQAAVNQQFMNAVAAVNHAEQALNDAVNAAVAAKQANPNFAVLMQAVSDAISQVIAIVDLYMQPTPPAPPSDAGAPAVAMKGVGATAASSVADLHAAYNSLSRWGVKIQTH